MIDAAGAIYVIGGLGDTGYFGGVWVSTDGGADRTRGILDGYSTGTHRVLCGTGVLHGTLGVFRGSCPGTTGLLEGYSDGASGILHARKRAKLEECASALEGVLCGVLFAEGVLGGNIILRGARWALQRTPGGLYAVRRGTQGDSGVPLRACAWRACKRGCTGTLVVYCCERRYL